MGVSGISTDLKPMDSGVRDVADVLSLFHTKLASGAWSPGTKLQNEKCLSATYGTTIHTVRKALQTLREEGLVYSRPKVGVFVTEQDVWGAGGAEELCLGCRAPREHLHFVTHSNLDSQRQVLDRAIQSFQTMEPGFELVTHRLQADQVPGKELDAVSDMIESCVPFFYHRIRDDMVDLGKYFAAILEVSPTDSKAVPLCYSTNYVCYRPELLDRLGVAPPSWRTYEEQLDYLESLVARLASHGLSLPGTSFAALDLLDSALPRILADFRDAEVTESEFLSRYSSVVRECTRFWQRYQLSFPRQARWHMSEFLDGKSPLFFTTTASILTMKEEYPQVSFGSYPYLTVEGRLPRLTVPLSIRRQTFHLVECARFFRELQNPLIQGALAGLGYVPLAEACYGCLPVDSRGFSGAEPLLMSTAEDFYLCFNILNVELWNIILFGKSVADALRDSLAFARGYLAFQLDDQGCRNREEHGRLYL